MAVTSAAAAEAVYSCDHCIDIILLFCNFTSGGSVAEWLACWTQVQKGPGSNHSRDAVR